MPSHPDRVRNNNKGICEICLKNPIALFASRDYLAINRFNICSECLEIRYEVSLKLGPIEELPNY